MEENEKTAYSTVSTVLKNMEEKVKMRKTTVFCHWESMEEKTNSLFSALF